jgi:pimeloyl-ACP methyl ester carboxylesterase
MRVAAKGRAHWRMASRPGLGDSQSLLLNAGVIDVVRLGRGEPLVLVPGLAGGWSLQAPLARRLARSHEVILYSLRGDRAPLASSRARDLTVYADDLAELIEELRLERPAVFGVSFGGVIALELALEHPDRVGALVLQGAEARFQANIGSVIARRVLERFPLPNDNGFLNQFFNLLHGGKPKPSRLVDFVVEHCWETDQSVMAHRLELLEHFDVSDRLWELDVPTLVLAGSRDVIVQPQRQRALAAAIGSSRFATLEGAGHIGFLTHREEVAQHVSRFLRDTRPSLC